LRRTLSQGGAPSALVVQADLEAGLPFEPIFDCVVVDAPCSGLGTIRRDPEIRWRRRESELAALASAQRRMLANAAAAVRSGGRLVYATCSSEPDENEDVVTAFLREHEEFQALDARESGTPPGRVRAVIDDAGHLRTYPHIHRLEAFFAASMQRRIPQGRSFRTLPAGT
jgi:16S rRNA (cytosine967-C5)-methyltransferase